MNDSLRFVENYSQLNYIDKSHNHHHSLEVLYWSSDILRHSGKKFTMDELKIIAESCILHDMIDRKYNLDTKHVQQYLFKKHDREIAETIMNIMDTMSYSKTFVNNKLKFPEWIVHSRYEDAYHVVREADLLSSYNIARMIEFRLAQQMSVPKIKREIVQFYNGRVANLVKRKFFIHPHAKKRARQLDNIGRLKLDSIDSYEIENNNLDFYRFVDFIDLGKIASLYDSIVQN